MMKVIFEILGNLWRPALPNTSLLEAISGTPLCKQEFALRKVTAGMGLQVRVSRTLERNMLSFFLLASKTFNSIFFVCNI